MARLPAVLFTLIVVSTYLYIYNVITVVLLGRVHRILSIARQSLVWKRKSSAKIDKTLQEPRIEGRKTLIVYVDWEATTKRWPRSKIRRNCYSCLTRPEISVGIILRDDNIFNSKQDVTGSARAKF